MSWPLQETPRWQRIVEDLRRAASPQGRKHLGGFAAEGWRVIKRGRASGHRLRFLLVSEDTARSPTSEEADLLRASSEAAIPIHVAPTPVVSALIEGRTFGAILGFFDALPPLLLDTPGLNKLLVLVHVQDPGNLGALTRTALASGVQALIVVGGTDPFHPKAVRSSMGSLFHLPIATASEPLAILTRLASLGFQQIGAVVEGGLPPALRPAHKPCALWIGSEAHGLPETVVTALDLLWSIPMQSCVDSFSINAATAILLYETYRHESLSQTSPVDRREQMARFRQDSP